MKSCGSAASIQMSTKFGQNVDVLPFRFSLAKMFHKMKATSFGAFSESIPAFQRLKTTYK